MRTVLAIVLTQLAMAGQARCAQAANFSNGATAAKYGVHEVTLTGDGGVANPFDTLVTVTFTPPSGLDKVHTVPAFHDQRDAHNPVATIAGGQ